MYEKDTDTVAHMVLVVMAIFTPPKRIHTYTHSLLHLLLTTFLKCFHPSPRRFSSSPPPTPLLFPLPTRPAGESSSFTFCDGRC